MNKDTPAVKDDRTKMKALREERKETLKRNRELLKKQNQEIGLLKKELKKAPHTVPDLAEATGLKSDKILWYISALRKYGEIEEGEETNGYFKYLLVKSSNAE